MERIGIYGGTFNPPHLGHIQGASYAAAALGLTRVLMIPDRAAPHKRLPLDSPSPEQRLEMTRIAAKSVAGAEASDLELQREGPSYTVDTVRQLHGMYPGAELVLLMGTDMFLSFANWRQPEEILKYVSLGVMCRGEKNEIPRLEEQKRVLEAQGGRSYLINNPIVEISSTDLRRMLVFRCAAPFLPEGVEAYIRENSLYSTGRDLRELPMEELERVVVGLLKPNRVAHVLGCRDTAARLARRWGADETDAARAGLLHDITKALDGPLQLTLCREYGIVLDSFSTENPKTLHALTGSLVAERIFGENPNVVAAIRSHTTGKADMNLLEKIIYVADYMEPNRDFPGVEELRALSNTDIDKALKLGLEMTIQMLLQQKRTVSPASAEALAYLREKGT